MSFWSTPLDRERWWVHHGGVPPAIDRERMRRAVHEAGHYVAAVALGHQVSQVVIDGNHPRTEFASPLPALIDQPVTYAGPWAEARYQSRTHRIEPELLRADDFEGYFRMRRESLCQLVEAAIGKAVQRDIDQGFSDEGSAQFEPVDVLDEDGFASE